MHVCVSAYLHMYLCACPHLYVTSSVYARVFVCSGVFVCTSYILPCSSFTYREAEAQRKQFVWGIEGSDLLVEQMLSS